MRTRNLSNRFDYGTLHVSGESFSDLSFVVCGLSLGVQGRSTFKACSFSNIKIRKCSVGFPIFEQCRFEDITSDRNGVLIYGAGFKECTFAGSLDNVVIGFASQYIPTPSEQCLHNQKFQADNIGMAAESGCAIDVTRADLEFVAFRGEAIIPYVRCAPHQAVILQATNLHETLVRLGRSQVSRAKSDFYLGTGVLPGNSSGIATFNREVRAYTAEIEKELREAGVEVRHYEA